MKAILTAAALLTALAAPAFALTPVGAGCKITDTSGNALLYVFADNTINGDTGTALLVGATKNNIDNLPAGREPVWSFTSYPSGLVMTMQADPSWDIAVTSSGAVLHHNQIPVGSGMCTPVGQDTIDKARTNERRVKIQANLPKLIDGLADIARGLQGQ